MKVSLKKEVVQKELFQVVDRARWPTVESTVLTLPVPAISGGTKFLWTGHFVAYENCLRH